MLHVPSFYQNPSSMGTILKKEKRYGMRIYKGVIQFIIINYFHFIINYDNLSCFHFIINDKELNITLTFWTFKF